MQPSGRLGMGIELKKGMVGIEVPIGIVSYSKFGGAFGYSDSTMPNPPYFALERSKFGQTIGGLYTGLNVFWNQSF